MVPHCRPLWEQRDVGPSRRGQGNPPGLLEGYLAAEDLPDSLALLPPPPKAGSAAFARDEEAARATFKLRGSPRWDQAVKDADLEFPAAADAFSDALGFEVTEKGTPHFYLLLRRMLTDAGLSTYQAKNKYQRKRPFMLNDQPIGTPDDEEGLRRTAPIRPVTPRLAGRGR